MKVERYTFGCNSACTRPPLHAVAIQRGPLPRSMLRCSHATCRPQWPLWPCPHRRRRVQLKSPCGADRTACRGGVQMHAGGWWPLVSREHGMQYVAGFAEPVLLSPGGWRATAGSQSSMCALGRSVQRAVRQWRYGGNSRHPAGCLRVRRRWRTLRMRPSTSGITSSLPLQGPNNQRGRCAAREMPSTGADQCREIGQGPRVRMLRRAQFILAAIGEVQEVRCMQSRHAHCKREARSAASMGGAGCVYGTAAAIPARAPTLAQRTFVQCCNCPCGHCHPSAA